MVVALVRIVIIAATIGIATAQESIGALWPQLQPGLVSQMGVDQGLVGNASSNYVFLQRFKLGNGHGIELFYHTEVVICPREGFDTQDQQLLDSKIAGMTGFAQVEDPWWEGKAVDCMEIGYGGAFCFKECCAVGFRPMKLNARQAVIVNADLSSKAMFLYGTGAFDGNAAFHHTCDKKCWSMWRGVDYNILTTNCNTFTSTVLSCVYGLSQKKPHLGVSDMVTVHGHCGDNQTTSWKNEVLV
jgi:hypothetical protein